jgi:hypothetical protein
MCCAHDTDMKSKSIHYMTAEIVFYTIMIVVFVGYGIVMHFMKRDEQRDSSR